MLLHFRYRIRSHPGNHPFYSILNPLRNQRINLPHTLTLEMATEFTSKRPTCPSCSKPTPLCLCTRMKTPILQNSVAVTVLQHSLEKNHPLNSTRIATLGLKNLDIVRVSDVHFEARFDIRLLRTSCGVGKGIDEPSLTFGIEKYCEIKPNFDQIFASSSVARDVSEKGFIVKKLQRKQINGSIECEECEEFEIAVPPGSVLLFPSENSVGVEAMNFAVNNLIVLDGTWAKAKRMYKENPWLKLLPHLRLDIDKLSLYGEVRNQPRAGYLSSIESIVYALKAVGGSPEGLDGLLEVFESMVCDQRRCKDERLSKAALM